jgi:hypothetical protein
MAIMIERRSFVKKRDLKDKKKLDDKPRYEEGISEEEVSDEIMELASKQKVEGTSEELGKLLGKFKDLTKKDKDK